jgi:hypothetical protein
MFGVKWQTLNLQLRDELGASFPAERRVDSKNIVRSIHVNYNNVISRRQLYSILWPPHKETIRGLPETTLPSISFI